MASSFPLSQQSLFYFLDYYYYCKVKGTGKGESHSFVCGVTERPIQSTSSRQSHSSSSSSLYKKKKKKKGDAVMSAIYKTCMGLGCDGFGWTTTSWCVCFCVARACVCVFFSTAWCVAAVTPPPSIPPPPLLLLYS